MEKVLITPSSSRADECLVAFTMPDGAEARVTAIIMDNGIVRTNLSIPATWRLKGVVGKNGEILPSKTLAKRSMRNLKRPQEVRVDYTKLPKGVLPKRFK